MNVKTGLAFATAAIVALCSTSELSAQALNDDIQSTKRSRRARIRYQMRTREDFHSPVFLNKFHPDWPVRGIAPNELGDRQAVYLRTHRRAYADSTKFRPFFHRRGLFSRRERWPYNTSTD